MNVSELLVSALERDGVRYVFGYPGDENLPFVEAVRASEQIRFVLTQHEAGAGFMAAAHGYQTGRLAVAMGTLGAGATNLVTSVAHAWLAELPMLVITGQKPMLDNRQGRYQLIDVVDVMRPITKMTVSVPSAQALPGLVADAAQRALTSPQGPVHLELPVDIAALDASGVELLPRSTIEAATAADGAIAAAVHRLAAARRPLVLIGAGASTRHAVAPAMRAFLDHTGLPFTATMMGKGVGDETSPRFMGTAGMPAMGVPHCAVQHADLIISVGHNVMEKAPFTMTTDGPDVVHVHEHPATPDTIWFPQEQVVGDIAHTLTGLTAALDRIPAWDLDGFTKLGAAYRMAITAGDDDTDGVPVKPQAVSAAVREALGPADILSLDNGIHKLWMTRNYPASQPRTVMVDSALGSMGPGIPAAIAAKLVHPRRRVVAVVGDGGFLMTGQELATAVRLDLDLVVLVFNDAGLGMIRIKQQMDGLQTHGVDFGAVDLAAVAEGYGAQGHRPGSGAEVAVALEKAFARGGVHVIDVPVDYGENAPLLMSLRMIDCGAILDT